MCLDHHRNPVTLLAAGPGMNPPRTPDKAAHRTARDGVAVRQR